MSSQPMYGPREGVNVGAITYASGGRNLFGGSPFGDATKWEQSLRNPPVPNYLSDRDWECESEKVTSALWTYNQQRDNYAWKQMEEQKAFTYNGWTTGHPIVSPLFTFQGDFGVNPFFATRMAWFAN